jgi:hypothetical protein
MSNEETEFWKAVKKDARDARATRRQSQFVDLIELEDMGYDVRVVNEEGYQFRINETIDIYPTNKKYHLLKMNKRGTYKDLKFFITNLLPLS